MINHRRSPSSLSIFPSQRAPDDEARLLPGQCKRGNEFDRTKCTVSITFIEVTFDTAEPIADMSETDERHAAHGRECIEPSRFHLDCENTFVAAQSYGFGRLTKRRIRRPRSA